MLLALLVATTLLPTYRCKSLNKIPDSDPIILVPQNNAEKISWTWWIEPGGDTSKIVAPYQSDRILKSKIDQKPTSESLKTCTDGFSKLPSVNVYRDDEKLEAGTVSTENWPRSFKWDFNLDLVNA